MPKLAVIGDSTSVLGFKPIGVDAYSLDDPQEVSEIWPSVVAADYAIVFMTEPIFEAALPLIKQIEARSTPAVLAIPSTAGSLGAGQRYIKDLMERAIGASIKSSHESEVRS
ncbi:MAG: V-type ATP synthase subunit F [Actinomycetota bacterium]|nr:V-type ATP synthase subunit F [Actinomycetota bacterium]